MKKIDLDTPFIIIDMDKVEQNIAAMQSIADRSGIKLRPHAKTHKIPEFAHKQISAGACGITVAKVGEAEVMAAAGVRDITIAYSIVGRQKLARLVKLAGIASITVAVDSFEVVEALSQAVSAEGVNIGVLVEIDCGFGRVGTAPGKPALDLAERITTMPGLIFKGLLTFGGHSYDAENSDARKVVGQDEGRIVTETADLIRKHGIHVETVSVGSTPSAAYVAEVPGITEIRPGTYIFGDLMQVKRGVLPVDHCALTVKVTVISRPEPHRAVIDAGTKVFTSDGESSPLGTGHGFVVGRQGIEVSWFTEEHGMLTLSPEAQDLSVGDTLEIIPVHCCAVVNMMDEVAIIRGEQVEGIWPVAGRGKVR